MGHGFLGIPNHIEPDLLLRAFEPEALNALLRNPL